VGYRHSREEILASATEVALEIGVGALTFAKVGQRLGISDRTVVYYFPTKPALVTSVVETMGADLVGLLEAAFGDEPQTPDELVRRAWPVLTTPAADRLFALYFEIVGLATTGEEPYATLARALVAGWAAWLTPRVRGSTAEIRRRRALAALARVDGLLLLRQVAGPEAAEAAARESGIRP
jgi:AcrR family transcriptional regulator